MNKEKLFHSVMNKLPLTEIHPLHKAMLEECCEITLENNSEITDEKTLVLAVHTAFLTSNTTLKATLKSSIEFAEANQVTLDYRDQKFVISKDSKLLK